MWYWFRYILSTKCDACVSAHLIWCIMHFRLLLLPKLCADHESRIWLRATWRLSLSDIRYMYIWCHYEIIGMKNHNFQQNFTNITRTYIEWFKIIIIILMALSFTINLIPCNQLFLWHHHWSWFLFQRRVIHQCTIPGTENRLYIQNWMFHHASKL